MGILRLKTQLVTPYTFLDIVKSMFPEKDMSLSQLTSIIDFFLSQPELTMNSSEELFFAALIYCFEHNGALPISFKIAEALTHRWN